MTPKTRDFHDFSTFLENCRAASRKHVGYLWSVLRQLRALASAYIDGDELAEKLEKMNVFFRHFEWFFIVSRRTCGDERD